MSAADYISKYSGVEMDSGIEGGLNVGDLSTLTTANKDNIVSAINELDQEKVSSETGKSLSQENFTTEEKNKLASLDGNHWKGTFTSLEQLNNAKVGGSGNYADVDAADADVVRYIWDFDNSKWVAQSGLVPGETAASIKTKYESNADTNVFTNDEKNKLSLMTAIFTTALKTAYDNSVAWINAHASDILSHISDTVKHITPEERSSWNSKSDKTYVDTQLDLKENSNKKGQANGYAPLDANAKIPLTHINDALLGNVQYQGLYDALANSPILDVVAAKGYYYIVTNSGTRFGISFNTGDWIISDGTAWGKVDNTDAVASVFGRTGNIAAQTGDYTVDQITETATKTFLRSTDKAHYETAYSHSQIVLGNPHNTTKANIGLGNVNNTSDSKKPVSDDQEAAIASAKMSAIAASRLFVKRLSFSTAKTLTATEQTLTELNYTITESGDYGVRFIANLISSDVTFILLTSMNTAFAGITTKIKKNGTTIATFNDVVQRANRQVTIMYDSAFSFVANDVITVTLTASLPSAADLSIPAGTENAISFSKIKLL